jgi:alpha-N-acetylglucosamine transferase
MQTEIWKPIVGYEGYYEISNHGNVRSINRFLINKNGIELYFKSKNLRPAINRDGYLQVGLSKNSKTNSYCIHHLEGIAFISNPENKPTINHIDGIKTNNYIDNLEWATKSEQAIHSLKYKLRTMPNAWIGKFGSKHCASKKVDQYTKADIFIITHDSIIEASKITNTNKSSIGFVCKGKKKTAGGYIWKYNVQ